LVDKDEVALEINSELEFSFDPTLFTFTAQPREGVSPRQVEKELYEELEKIKTNGITEHELQKAKNALLVGHYKGLSTIAGKANALGNYELFFGDYKRLLSAHEDYAKVTAEDVRKVAQKYFNERNRTVVTLVPDGKASEQKSPEKDADE